MLKLYSKPGCSLCDKAKLALQAANLEFEEVNILEHPKLLELYQFEIPVLVDASGKELLKGIFSEARVAGLKARL
jgi:arsenate reductase-like glutaredoxin family protein